MTIGSMAGSLSRSSVARSADNRKDGRALDPRTTRAAANYAAVAEQIAAAGERCVERAGVEPGMEVLDVACGTGNATIPAARAGARVTGLDLSPDLLSIARERAADAMVEVDWVVGDPRLLPFEDGSFDRVISIFGNPSLGEMRRVCRGRIGICSWTPDGAVGRMLGM